MAATQAHSGVAAVAQARSYNAALERATDHPRDFKITRP
jgi:hypothetical protein